MDELQVRHPAAGEYSEMTLLRSRHPRLWQLLREGHSRGYSRQVLLEQAEKSLSGMGGKNNRVYGMIENTLDYLIRG